MRILAFFFHFAPMSGGGPVVAADIVNGLAGLGHEVTVLVPDVGWTGPPFEPVLDPKIWVVRVAVPSRGRMKVAARMCRGPLERAGVRLGREAEFDFVFSVFHPFHRVPAAAVSCARRLGVPSVIKIDDAVYAGARGLKAVQRRIERMINSRTLRRSSRVLVPNERVGRIAAGFYGVADGRMATFPNGVDTGLFHKRGPVTGKTAVFSGAMYRHRGLDVLLDAVPEVVSRVPDARFVLLGDGPEMDSLREMVTERGLEGAVTFRGWVDRREIPAELGAASVGIAPLRSTEVTRDALPIKVLEYMASGLPVIGARDTLSRQLLEDGENGFLVGGREELAEKLVLLLSDSELNRRMGEKSAEMVRPFSWEGLAGDIVRAARDQ